MPRYLLISGMHLEPETHHPIDRRPSPARVAHERPGFAAHCPILEIDRNPDIDYSVRAGQPSRALKNRAIAMTAGMALFIIDALLVTLVWPLTFWLAVRGAAGEAGWLQILIFAASDLLFLYALGLYRRDVIVDIQTSLGRIPLVVAIAVVAAGFVTMALGWVLSPALFPAPNWAALFIAATVSFTACAMSARLAFPMLRRHRLFRPRLLVMGAGKRAWDLVWILRSQGRNLQYDVTFVHDETFGAVDPRLAADPANHIVSASGNLLEIAGRARADQIVVAPDERRGMALEALIGCKTAGYPVLHYMRFLEKEVRRIDIKRLDLTWVLYSDGFYFGPLDRALKRILDITVSLLILTVFSPILLLGMLAVRLGDGGSVFYKQERVTLGGRKFQIQKLRTMRMNAESGGAVWAAAGDSRITRVGAFLRRSRIDELPQLFNVLIGDMSLVGPRPERPEFIEELAKQLPLYVERHAVKAGMTGWAQINYPYGASLDDARSKLSYDLYYVKNFSIFFDLLIIMQTLRVVIWPGGGVR
ncbi:MAG TPA: TIGR03013 family XrtA/PEP-CTERM system glycosyltransferase [Micropepsaceae bacterium]|nr:TIGR03013 family XrtA/PEP-CTERM system glycosyltransferase [Micropepsaceae bacterium]